MEELPDDGAALSRVKEESSQSGSSADQALDGSLSPSVKVERASQVGNHDALAGENIHPTQVSSCDVSDIKVEWSGACQMPTTPERPLGPTEHVESRNQDEQESQGSEKPAPPSGSAAAGTKRKQWHMDVLDCSDLAQTEMGAMALTNPVMVRKSSLDSNRGPYPMQWPPRSLQGNPRLQYVSARTKTPSPSKITLSKEQMRNQSKIDQYFTVSPRKKTAKDSPSPTPNRAAVSFAASPPIHKKCLSAQFASMGPPLLQVQRNTASPTLQRTGPMLNQSAERPSPGMAGSPKSRPNDQSHRAFQPSPPISQGSTETNMYVGPNQSPCSSPAKLSKSTVDSDIEDFYNDNSWDELDADLALNPPSGLNLVQSSIPGSQGSTPDKVCRKSDNQDEQFQNKDSDIQSQASSSQPHSGTRQETFGLLGEGPSPGCSESDGDDPGSLPSFDSLPLEVLEKIFCFAPISAYLSLCLVCKHWSQIISREDFMPWKQTYSRLRLNSLLDVPDRLVGSEVKEDTCLLALIRGMPKFKARFSSVMDRDLQRHPKYALAKDIIKSRAPELVENEAPNPWSCICLLVLLSETVQDVLQILTCLLHPTSSCTTMEVLECLYCIAAYLWKYNEAFKLNGGCHYRVYHALYLFENTCSFSAIPLPTEDLFDQGAVPRSPLALPRHSFLPTHEQCRILNHDVERGKVVKIVAFAGTGKTTTLVKYAERRPDTSFLYVAFNKSVQKHATGIFPQNVTSRTTHSLAYEVVGRRYKQKLGSSLNAFFVHKLLPAQHHSELHWLRYASLVCKTIQWFCASADDFITTRHVPSHYNTYSRNGDLVVAERHVLDHAQKMSISDHASLVWQMMINVENKEAYITHDVYLKLFQLQKPWYFDYDCILIDEAQDLTPAQQDILLNQPGAKILVGDPNQQIYSFRGATDAMRAVECDTTLHLTQSFRFGTEIAYIANCLLERTADRNSPHSTKPILIGRREAGRVDGQEIGKVAIITRTNVTLFIEAVKIVEADSRTTLAFAGGIERYGMDVILDIYQLLQPVHKRGFIKNKHIFAHKSFQALKHHAAQTENLELLAKIRIVDIFSVRIPMLLDKIRSRTKPEAMADIILSTAHQAKGLEFDTVKVTDDFGINEARLGPLVVVDRDELNMVYVAITRAKESLVLNQSLMRFIGDQPTWEKFAYPAPAKRVETQDPYVCVECKEQIPSDGVMLLKKKTRKVAYPTAKQPGGLLCLQCSLQTYPALRCILG